MKNPATTDGGDPQSTEPDDQSDTEDSRSTAALSATITELISTWPPLTEAQAIDLRSALRGGGELS